MDMNELLQNLYESDEKLPSLEKTAEARLMNELSVQENPYMDLSTAELVKLAQQLDDNEEIPSELNDEEDMQKVAMDMLGGQIMAHSMMHEFGLMKQAMVNGLCRVCKTNPFDVEGSSICSHCME